MGRIRNRSRSVTLGAIAAATIVGSSCVPPEPPEPPQPAWTATRVARTTSAEGSVNRIGAWTDDSWFATVEMTSAGGSTSWDLAVHPRSGSGAPVLGAPQRLPLAGTSTLGPIGEHLIGVPNGAGGADVAFFRESDGVWAAAGSLAVAEGDQAVAMTDDWLVVRRIPIETGGDGQVQVYALDDDGTQVIATLAAVLGPDPTWPVGLRRGFGHHVSLDGDLLAVSGTSLPDPGPGGLRVFRYVEGAWAAAQSLGGQPTTAMSFGRTHDVDDGDTVDRLTLSPVPVSPTDIGVHVWSDTGSGFAFEHSIEPDLSLPDHEPWRLWGSSLAIDGDLIAVTSRSTTVPSADPAHDPVQIGHVALHRLTDGTWQPEAEVAVGTSPFPAGVRSSFPWTMHLAGSHLAVGSLLNLDVPPGCPFPCFSTLAFEAWSFDRN